MISDPRNPPEVGVVHPLAEVSAGKVSPMQALAPGATALGCRGDLDRTSLPGGIAQAIRDDAPARTMESFDQAIINTEQSSP